MRRLRDALDPADRALASAAASATLIDVLDRDSLGTVMSFVSIRSEIDTAELHEWVSTTGRRLVLPRTDGARLDAVEWVVGRPMSRSAIGVLEPLGPAVDVASIDAVIVPGLAFDRGGGRLGYGAGYYDRFLGGLRPAALTIGLCFIEQVVERVPCEDHDRHVTMVVSGSGVEFDGRPTSNRS